MTWDVSRCYIYNNTKIWKYIYVLSLPEFTIWAEFVEKLGKVRMSTTKLGSIILILTGSSNTYKQFLKVQLKFIRSWLSSLWSAWNKWYSSTNNNYYSSSYVELKFIILNRFNVLHTNLTFLCEVEYIFAVTREWELKRTQWNNCSYIDAGISSSCVTAAFNFRSLFCFSSLFALSASLKIPK